MTLKRTPLKSNSQLKRKTPMPRASAKKPAKSEKGERYSFVVCPACEHFYGGCPVCKDTQQVKVIHKRFAPKSGPPRAIKSPAPQDDAWSYQIKERDNWTCRWCGKKKEPWIGKDGLKKCPSLQAAHLFGRGKQGTRLDIRNGFTACGGPAGCHARHMSSSDPLFHEWAKEEVDAMYGAGTYDELERLSQPQKIVKRRQV